MEQKIREYVHQLLSDRKIKGFLGLREDNGHIMPHLFCTAQDLEDMSLGDAHRPGDARYPLNQLLIRVTREYPDDTFAVLVRGCDERGLKELFKWNQLREDRVIPVGLGCPDDLARACACAKPFPDCMIEGPRGEKSDSEQVARIDGMNLEARLEFWTTEFGRCIKCFGCRNVCPMCFCNECSLEEDSLVGTGKMPPDNPAFHLTRAVHMVGRCIDCGLCEEACPSDIPLRALYKKVTDIVTEEFGYRTGYTVEQKSPFNIIEE
jgi:ferredoxin